MTDDRGPAVADFPKIREFMLSVLAAAGPCAAPRVGPEHVLLAAAESGDEASARALEIAGLSAERIVALIRRRDETLFPLTVAARDATGVDDWQQTINQIPFSPAGKQTVNLSALIALSSDDPDRDLWACAVAVSLATPEVSELLQANSATIDDVRAAALAALPDAAQREYTERLGRTPDA